MNNVGLASRSWHEVLAKLFAGARRELLVCSPYVARAGTQFVTDHVGPGFQQQGRIRFVTNLSVLNVCQLSTDPRALKHLVDAVPGATIYHLPGLHAKVYIADDEKAIVTSGNLTAGGLYHNYEYGIEIGDPNVVRRISQDISEFVDLGAHVPREPLIAYCEAIENAYAEIRREQRTAQRQLASRLRSSLKPIEDSLIRLRLGGGSVHGIFARTIEYSLRTRGPLSTVQLHPLIAAIHPDLCDDSVDRVIDGKRFGKKWKHAVRTAQQQLKRHGKARCIDGLWELNVEP